MQSNKLDGRTLVSQSMLFMTISDTFGRLHCHSYCGDNKTSVYGGLKNARRNRIQICLQLAIDIGASVIIPSGTTRDEADLRMLNSVKTVCPDHFWDLDYLRVAMGKSVRRWNFESAMIGTASQMPS